MTSLAVPMRKLPHGADLPMPSRATPGSAGVDLMAAVGEPMILEAGARSVVPAGIAVALPDGYEGQIRPRSGLAARHGVTVLNSPGTIDSDYRGEIGVILINLGDKPFRVDRGMRIAQLVVAPVTAIRWHTVAELPATTRAEGGFGSTGGGDIEGETAEGGR